MMQGKGDDGETKKEQPNVVLGQAPNLATDDDAFVEALTQFPSRELLLKARSGDREPLASLLDEAAEALTVLEARRSLSGKELREHQREHRNANARAEALMRRLADPKLLHALALLVREGKIGGPKWMGSKSKRRQKLEAWAEIHDAKNSADPPLKDAAAIEKVANDPETLRSIGIDTENSEDQARVRTH